MIAQCISAFAQMRGDASHLSELVSQLIRGECVWVLRDSHPWVWIQTEYGYVGFCRSEQLSILSEEATTFQYLYRLQKTKLPFHSHLLQILEPEGSLILSSKPLVDVEMDYIDISGPLPFSARLMAQQAMNLLTVPYVWGGKTVFGLDCSGLVQFLFQKQGYSFPRDAWQQAEQGLDISFDASKPEFEPGDLLYFQNPGKRIHHVAISLGGNKYIHASEWVRINSLYEEDADFQKDRKETFVHAKRIQPETLVSLLDSFRKL